jgi:hypothetical protein
MGGLPGKFGLAIQARLSPMPQRIALTGQLFAQAAELLKNEYDAKLVILIWDRWSTDDLYKALAPHDLTTVRLSTIFGDYRNQGLEILPDVDLHPTRKANGMTARLLADMERARDQTAGEP